MIMGLRDMHDIPTPGSCDNSPRILCFVDNQNVNRNFLFACLVSLIKVKKRSPGETFCVALAGRGFHGPTPHLLLAVLVAFEAVDWTLEKRTALVFVRVDCAVKRPEDREVVLGTFSPIDGVRKHS